MSEIRTIRYAARDVSSKVVFDFARAAGYMLDGASLGKAKRALRRCLSRALYVWTSKAGRERWQFTHRKMHFQVLVQDEIVVQVVRVLRAKEVAG